MQSAIPFSFTQFLQLGILSFGVVFKCLVSRWDEMLASDPKIYQPASHHCQVMDLESKHLYAIQYEHDTA